MSTVSQTKKLNWFKIKKRIRLFVLLFVFLSVLSAGGYVTFLRTIDMNLYREVLEQRATQMIGSPVKIEGDLQIDFMGPKVTISNIRVLNPNWTSNENMAMLQRVSLTIDFIALFQKKISIKTILLEDGEIRFEHGIYGAPNWNTNPGFLSSSWLSEEDDVRHVAFKNVRIFYNFPHQKEDNLLIKEMIFETSPNRDTTLEMQSMIWERPFQVKVTTGSLRDLQDRTENWPVRVSIAAEAEDHAIKVREESKKFLAYYPRLDVAIKQTGLMF